MSARLFFVLFFSFAAILSAQTITGSVTGVVADATGSHIPGVKLKLIASTTGAVREVETNHEGAFDFHALQPGTYTLHAEAVGFNWRTPPGG